MNDPQNVKFETIKLKQLQYNPFDIIQNRGMLLTAGDDKLANSMMINWGMMGILWNRCVVEVMVRPQRHTKTFLDEQDCFSLSLFDTKYKDKMLYFGTHSGKTEDKYLATDFHLDFHEGIPYITESKFVLFCRKLYIDEFDPNGYLEKLVAEEHYQKGDFHTRYIAEVELVLRRIE